MPNQTNVLLARQPIFDSNLNTVGYELLYRPIPTDEEGWQNHCGDLATNEVLVNAFDNIGIKNVTDNKPAYINFTQHWLHNPPPFNPEHVIIEVLEHILPTEENIKAISKLRDKGFTLALDDYLGDPAQDAFLPYINIIKLDILAFKSMPKVKQTILDKGKDKYIWLAEKVETQEEYDLCVKAGCNFFQGFFFSKPINVYGEAMNSNKRTILELIIYLQNPDTTIEDLEVILSKDPSLSYRLLKLVNSAAFSRQYLVESLQQAIIIAGFDQIKAWVIMLSLGKMSDKPLELCKQSLQRAYFLQHLAQAYPETDKNTAFTAGLLSNLDAFFDSPLSKILDKVNLHNDINTALINKRGKLGFMYSTVLLMERGLWNKIRWDLWKKVGLSSSQVEWLYLESIKETDKLFKTTS
jgi:EAL and modified HD-GYP domain-containing signal transduction protein